MKFRARGRTSDIDRPLTYSPLAEDAAALLHELKVEKADVFGYRTGGGVAFHLAAKHPARLRQSAMSGAGIGSAETTYEMKAY